MKIYNSGHRNYAMGTITIAPSRTKPTDIPPELEEHARWLLKTYSAELSEAPESGINVAALASKDAELAEAKRTIAEQAVTLANLQRLLTRDSGDTRVRANRRADAAELALDDANAKVVKLEALLAGRPALDEDNPQVQTA